MSAQERLAGPPVGHHAMDLAVLKGPRVRLRPWQAEDLPAFARLNADARAMAHFPSPLTRAASDALAHRCQALIDSQGWGFWAVERHDAPGGACFIGFTGLHRPAAELPFSPCVEIGWRLLPEHWGQGLATEAAQLALRAGFEQLGLTQIVAFTAVGNRPSRAVMARLGMRHDARDDFDHPAVPPGHALRRHVLYRLDRERWHTASYAPPAA